MGTFPYPRFLLSLLFCLFLPCSASAVTPETVEGAITATTKEAYELFNQSIIFFDVRNISRFKAGHIASAIHLDSSENFTPKSLSKFVKKNTPFVLYCDGVSCGRSAVAARMAVGWGFTSVYYYRGGFPEWRDAGYPLE